MILGDEVALYKRPGSSLWQCETYLAGKRRRKSTMVDSLSLAKEFAEDWYFELRGKERIGELKDGVRFPQAAQKFMAEYRVITQGQRSPIHVENQERRIRLHLIPYFGQMLVKEITAGTVQEYRIYRTEQAAAAGKTIARSTMHQEIVALRQVLKAAQRHGWIQFVPDLSPPYKTSGKITHRGWFSHEEYRRLYEATRKRAKNPLKSSYKWTCEQMHDFVLFMANTGLRPDEAYRLEHRDVKITRDHESGETILEIEVRGKRGLGFCKSTASAVRPFLRLRERNNPQGTDLVFPGNHRELFNAILKELDLKIDREGNRRTAYSLRHTYICFRLMEGADIYQIAKNCRTSVEMIEKFYAAHIKNRLDASAINVRRSRSHHKPFKAKRTSSPRTTVTKSVGSTD